MKISRTLCGAVLVMAVLAMTAGLAAQEEVLSNVSPNVRALRSLREPLQMFGTNLSDNPIAQATSPDSQALETLHDAASDAASELGSVIDLLAIYDNMQCDADRAMLKPLLEDRLRLYSRLLGFDAEKAILPLGPPNIVKLPATTKKALKLHDDVMAAKNKLDEITASVK